MVALIDYCKADKLWCRRGREEKEVVRFREIPASQAVASAQTKQRKDGITR